MGAALPATTPLIPIWVPNPGPQTLLVTCPVWDVLYGGARGGGKTDGLLGDFIGFSLWLQQLLADQQAGRTHPGIRLLPRAHARGFFFRRTYDELDEAIARSHELLGPLGATWKASKHTWILPWGGFLKMRYLQRDSDAARYQGHSYNCLLGDEVGNFPSPDPIKKLTATLRDRNGVPVRKRLSANPGGPGHAWLKADYVTPAPPFTPHADPGTGRLRVYIPSKLSDNLALVENDPEYAMRLRGSGPAWLVQAWLEGDWNATPEGGIIRIAWFRRYFRLPVRPEAFLRVHSWDTAYKADQHNDPSVMTDWHCASADAGLPPGFYLGDVFHDRLTVPEVRRRIIEFAERDSPDAVLIEDKSSGQGLIQDLRNSTTLPVIAIEPQGDKVSRALRVAPLIEAGRVMLPEHAPWLLDYELELTLFPTKGVHDDRVDSTTQALEWMAAHASRAYKVHTAGQTRVGAGTTSGSTPGIGWGSMGTSDTSGFIV